MATAKKAAPAKKAAVKKPAAPAKKVVTKKAPPKKQMFDKKVEPTPKTAKRKLSDATIKKMAKAMTPAKKTTTVKGKSPKELATARGEPYVEILSVELDPDNIGNGAFEIDWNDIFLAKLVRAGYQGKTDNDIIDNWFKTICKNVVMEEYEQWEANQPASERPRVVERRDLGDGKTEVS